MEKYKSHNGLLRYLDYGNTETIMVTEPATIGEFLQINQYHYDKVASVKKFVSQFLGNGLSMIDGDEHKVSPSSHTCKDLLTDVLSAFAMICSLPSDSVS